MSVEDVGFAHRGRAMLFRHVTFVLGPGATYALTGPSGAGKSTLLSLLSRWAVPTEGTITLEGISRVNWVFQNPYGMARRTALDHVAVPLLDAGETPRDAAAHAYELLLRFGLEASSAQEFRTLSGGQAQRLMLARAVAADPDLLLVDEPTAQLDRRTAAEVNAVMGQLADEGRIVVVATHDEETRASCSRSLSMSDWTPVESVAS